MHLNVKCLNYFYRSKVLDFIGLGHFIRIFNIFKNVIPQGNTAGKNSLSLIYQRNI